MDARPHIDPPYLLFLGDARDELAAKTARGVFAWRPELCLGQLRLDGCNARLDLPEMTIEEAAAGGARTLVVGVANRGGVIGDDWLPTLLAALDAGLDLASGLHSRLGDVPAIRERAEARRRRLFDARHPPREFSVGSGTRRAGKRLLTVGTDASVGKMYTTLALEAALCRRGVACTFRATGQTGIFVAGEGVSVDAVVADFISGAVEWLAPANDPDHWDLIEGQGSLFHPSFAGVTLGLIHGAQPDAIVVCHEPTRAHMRGLPGWPLPEIGPCITANLEAARLTNPDVVCAGLSIDTHGLAEADAGVLLAELAEAHSLPCVDPMRTGVGPIADRLV